MKSRMLTATFMALATVCVACATESPVVSVAIDDIVNGEVNLSEFGAVSTGQPDATVLRSAANAGYVAVIDLRGETENRGIDEQAEVKALGMKYLSLPIAGEAAISYENAAALDHLLDATDGPVLLHCGSGNRVGALIALREKMRGASDDKALEAGKAAGLTGLEGVVRERLAEGPQ